MYSPISSFILEVLDAGRRLAHELGRDGAALSNKNSRSRLHPQQQDKVAIIEKTLYLVPISIKLEVHTH